MLPGIMKTVVEMGQFMRQKKKLNKEIQNYTFTKLLKVLSVSYIKHSDSGTVLKNVLHTNEGQLRCVKWHVAMK